MIVRELITALGFDLKDAAFKKYEKEIDKFKSSIKSLAILTTAVAGGLIAITKTAANTAEEILKTSQRTGIATDELQKLEYAAYLSDVGVDTLTRGLTVFSKNIVAARDGSKEATEAFKKLGIDPRKLTNNEDAIIAVADAFSKMADGQEKSALGTAIFSRSFNELLPFLNQGGDAIRAAGQQLEAFGGVLGIDALKAGNEFNDNLKRMATFFKIIRNLIGARLFPIFNKLIERFTVFVTVNRDLIRTKIDKFLDGMVAVIEALVRVLGILGNMFIEFVDFVGGAENATRLLTFAISVLIGSKIISGVMALTKAFGFLAAAIGLAELPLAAIVIAIVAALGWIYLLFDDISGFFEGKDSVAGRFFNLGVAIRIWGQAVYRDITGVFSAINEYVKLIVQQMVGYFLNPIDTLKDTLAGKFVEARKQIDQGLFASLGGLRTTFVSGSQAIPKALENDRSPFLPFAAPLAGNNKIPGGGGSKYNLNMQQTINFGNQFGTPEEQAEMIKLHTKEILNGELLKADRLVSGGATK